ncbi:ABC transporter permease [Paenibacillus sp.]|jgi:ABC-2 type transport system permease protein|uniref:ABC transporter permease n=1 Tax=Paenibacillus sp. TaxID=58172 RepID=UPI002828443B|nr:ABC transporter permease [Paenibacillus sp.]MDR0268554.1 ABC transporter permease [Paenibacillus sp.]
MTGSDKDYLFRTPGSLFRRRLWSYFKEMAAIFRSVADDWTVFVYILIPGLLFGGRLYYGLWNEPLPEWASKIPFPIIPLMLLAVASMGGVILLIREADVLFIVQRKRWVRAIMLRGSLYSMAAAALKTAFVFLLILPFLIRQFHESGMLAGSMLAFTIVFGWVHMWIRHLVRVQTSGWRRWLLYIPFVMLPAFFYLTFMIVFKSRSEILLIGTIVLALFVMLLLRMRLRLRGTFMNDVQEDLTRRTRLTAIVLSQSVDKPRRIRRKTWIFRRSRPLFRSVQPSKRIAGTMVKALLRHPGQRSLYLRFAAVSIPVFFLPMPSGVRIIVYAALHLLIVYWLFLQWFSFKEDPFVSLLPWPDDMGIQASILAVRTLLFPYAVIISALILFTSGAMIWIAAIGFIPLAAGVTWVVPEVLRMFMMNKEF